MKKEEKENPNGIELMEFIIGKPSALEYADQMIVYEKEMTDEQGKDYEKYMKETYAEKEDATLEECIEASKFYHLKYYSYLIDVYIGFRKYGKVFVLDREQKVVCLIFDQDESETEKEKGHKITSLYVYYNPLGFDITGYDICSDCMKDSDKIDFSKDADKLVKELDELIKDNVK